MLTFQFVIVFHIKQLLFLYMTWSSCINNPGNIHIYRLGLSTFTQKNTFADRIAVLTIVTFGCFVFVCLFRCVHENCSDFKDRKWQIVFYLLVKLLLKEETHIINKIIVCSLISWLFLSVFENLHTDTYQNMYTYISNWLLLWTAVVVVFMY